jgi:hypothetical protein
MDNFFMAGCIERLLETELILPTLLRLTFGSSIAASTSDSKTPRGFSSGSRTADEPSTCLIVR